VVERLGISPEDLAQRFPRLYHMAADGAWESIAQHGLLSTSSLLDLFGYAGERRNRIEGAWRPESVTIRSPEHGNAVVRDQKPMDDSGLRRCLRDMTPAEWYRLLNSRVFFWLTEERLDRMLTARAYRNELHLVLVVDTAGLLRAHHTRVALSPINSGATKPYPQPRGKHTFQRLPEYPFHELAAKRSGGGTDPVVELAVDHAVPDIARHVVRLERRRGSTLIEELTRK
jgi:hypothetical protein